MVMGGIPFAESPGCTIDTESFQIHLCLRPRQAAEHLIHVTALPTLLSSPQSSSLLLVGGAKMPSMSEKYEISGLSQAVDMAYHMNECLLR